MPAGTPTSFLRTMPVGVTSYMFNTLFLQPCSFVLTFLPSLEKYTENIFYILPDSAKKRLKEVGLISWLIVSIQIRNDMTHCAHLPVTLTRQSAHPNIEADIFCWRVTSCGSTCSATDIDDVAGASISWLPIGMWLMGSDNLSKSKRSTTP